MKRFFAFSPSPRWIKNYIIEKFYNIFLRCEFLISSENGTLMTTSKEFGAARLTTQLSTAIEPS
jgi:hypothetical protein